MTPVKLLNMSDQTSARSIDNTLYTFVMIHLLPYQDLMKGYKPVGYVVYWTLVYVIDILLLSFLL